MGELIILGKSWGTLDYTRPSNSYSPSRRQVRRVRAILLRWKLNFAEYSLSGSSTPRSSPYTSSLHSTSTATSRLIRSRSSVPMLRWSTRSSMISRTRRRALVQSKVTLNSLRCFLTVLIVLRMLSDYVGEDKFLNGVSIYLKKHLYANTVTRNLWEGIQEASGAGTTQHLRVLI